MRTDINDYIVKSASAEWLPLIEKGKHHKGLFVKSLRYDQLAQRSKTILLRFEAGASYPYHNHPDGEELFVLQGNAIIEETLLTEGDYLYTPPGFKHAVKTDVGCTILFIIPKEVEIL